MTKSTQMWSVNFSYYKYGDSDIYSFVTEEELRSFLISKIEYYTPYIVELQEEDIDLQCDIKTLIDIAISCGSVMISYQYGWGVTKVHMLDFEKQEIEVYN